MSAQPPDAPAVPHCYRHPDRETWISCQRCGRPICPDCMHSASVGFQCPECIREGRRTTRAPRTIGGGLVPRRAGDVTWTLMGLNVLAYIAVLATPTNVGSWSRVEDYGVMLPASTTFSDAGHDGG